MPRAIALGQRVSGSEFRVSSFVRTLGTRNLEPRKVPITTVLTGIRASEILLVFPGGDAEKIDDPLQVSVGLRAIGSTVSCTVYEPEFAI
jgi:hypothetical protein